MEEIKLLNDEIFKKEDILKKMMNDEFYYGYLGKNALSSSTCKSLLEGPQFYANKLNEKEKTKESQPLRDGRLIHLLSLEPHRIDELTIIDSTKGSNAYKLAVQEQLPQTVYTNSELNRCKNIADSVLENDEFREMVRFAHFEKPEIGYYNGLPFRGKADICLPGIVIDLKTTSDISRFDESALHWNYDLQAALYLKLFNAFEFKYVVVDKKTQEVKFFEFSDDFIQGGYEKLNIATDNYFNYLQDKSFYDLNI
jgi:hypothetical protein